MKLKTIVALILCFTSRIFAQTLPYSVKSKTEGMHVTYKVVVFPQNNKLPILNDLQKYTAQIAGQPSHIKKWVWFCVNEQDLVKSCFANGVVKMKSEGGGIEASSALAGFGSQYWKQYGITRDMVMSGTY